MLGRGEVRLGLLRPGVLWYGKVWIYFKDKMAKKKEIIGGDSPTNGAKNSINYSLPYTVSVEICGSSDLLFHRWNNEAVAEKSAAAKGSKAKKSDDIESFVYRNENGELCIPGEYLRGAICIAAKFKQDPRSPRKSALDLYKAGIICLTNLASLGISDWDYIDMRRVVIQRSAITRSRPALRVGWKTTIEILVNLPEYISRESLLDTLSMAGKLVGIGDFRPTFGRFQVTKFE